MPLGRKLCLPLELSSREPRKHMSFTSPFAALTGFMSARDETTASQSNPMDGGGIPTPPAGGAGSSGIRDRRSSDSNSSETDQVFQTPMNTGYSHQTGRKYNAPFTPFGSHVSSNQMLDALREDQEIEKASKTPSSERRNSSSSPEIHQTPREQVQTEGTTRSESKLNETSIPKTGQLQSQTGASPRLLDSSTEVDRIAQERKELLTKARELEMEVMYTMDSLRARRGRENRVETISEF